LSGLPVPQPGTDSAKWYSAVEALADYLTFLQSLISNNNEIWEQSFAYKIVYLCVLVM